MTKIISAGRENLLSDMMYQNIKSDYDAGKNIILVVPAQSTLSSEKKAFDVFGVEGFLRFRIIRGKKLYEEIQKQAGFPGLISINNIGRRLLLRKITEESYEEFKAFSGMTKEDGFLDLAGDFISQLKQNDISEEEYCRLISETKDGSIMKKKLQDMKLINDKYKEAMSGKFTDSEDMLAFVTNKVKYSKLVKESVFYYFGFYSFTSKELKFLSELDKYSEGLTVAILNSAGDMYKITSESISRIKAAIPSSEIIRSEQPAAPIFSGIKKENIHFVRCAGPYTQAQTIASEIIRLTRENGYSYKDIAVLTGESSSMKGVIERVFSYCEIPFFSDETRNIIHNKGAEAVIDLLNIAADNFRATDVIRFLKTKFIDVEDNSLNQFSNYVKQYHIKGSGFLKPFVYGKEKLGYDFDNIERVRKLTASYVADFCNSFNQASSVKEKTEVLYAFLDKKLHLSDMLDKSSQLFAQQGYLDAAEEYSQIWDEIINLFDQLVELIGDCKLSSGEYAEIFKSACADIKVGVLPQSEGKVQLGSIGRSVTGDVRALFVAGFNDGLIPQDTQCIGILTDNELEFLEKKGCKLSKSADDYSNESLFAVYKALECPNEYIWLGYCLSNSDGAELKISGVLSELKKQFKDVAEENDIANRPDDISYLEGKYLAGDYLAENIRTSFGNSELPPVWKETYNKLKGVMPQIKEGIHYSNEKKCLGKDGAGKLFAKDGIYSLSPSRMDGFAACPFKHYIKYGLKPYEPKEFAVGGSEVGSVYHEALLRLCQKVSDWNNISDSELEAMLDEILDNISKESLDGILLAGKAESYTSKRIKKVCIDFAGQMAAQIREGNISEMLLEASFGRGCAIPAVELSTAAGKLYIEGRIDRIDVCQSHDGKYIRVIDYKSGATSFNKSLIEQGLSLQLMVYLEGALGRYTAENGAGIYYFRIKEPLVLSKMDELYAEETAKEVFEKLQKEYKLSGMDVDEEFFSNFSKTLTGLCEKLALGDISVEPKKVGNSFDSCEYCSYSSVCRKNIM